jgi:hypothetical protein
MSRMVIGVLLLTAVVASQAGPTFEVASIRPSSEQVTEITVGVRIAGSHVRFVAMPLKEWIVNAYGVRPQQIVGPDWLGQLRFDLAATIPAGGSAEQLPQMLQALLADRFQMKMHRESREFLVYALGVAKGGPQFQPSKPPDPAAATAGEKPPEVNVVASGTGSGTSIDLGGGSSVFFGNTDPLSGPLRNVGLTLEPRRAPLDVIVMESIAKTPTEN